MVDTVEMDEASSATNIFISAGNGQGVAIEASNAVVTDEDGGDVQIRAGSGLSGSGGGGLAAISGGQGGDATGNGGDASVNGGGGGSISGDGGDAKLTAGDATEGNGGSCVLYVGQTGGAGAHGNLIIYNLPTVDPGIANPSLVGIAIWNDANVLKVSAGA